MTTRKVILASLAASLAIALPAKSEDDSCGLKWWKRDVTHADEAAYYYGQVSRRVRTVHIEVWRRGRLIGTGVARPNPQGRFRDFVIVSAPFLGSKVRFYCD